MTAPARARRAGRTARDTVAAALTGAALLAALTGIALLAAFPAFARSASSSPATSEQLRAHAAELFERRSHAMREGGIPLDPLQAELVDLAVQLEAAHLDSLACDARWWAANLLSRLARRSETDQQLIFSIADAIKAHDEKRAMRGRLWQADLKAQSDPPLAIRTAEEAVPRLRELGWDGLLGNAYSTEARAYMEMGRARDSYVTARYATAHYAAARDTSGVLWAMSQCSQALRYLGRHPEARAITDSAIAMARAARLSRPLSRALLESASIHRTSLELPEALADVTEALAEDRRRGDTGTSITTRIFRGRIYLMMHRDRECAADMDTLLDLPQVQQTMTTLAHVATMRARAISQLSREAEADTLLAGVATRFERFRAGLPSDEDRAGAGEHVADLYATWARVKLMMGRTEDAWRVSERGRAFALKTRLGIVEPPDLTALEARLRETHVALIEFDLVDPELATVFRVSGDGVVGLPLESDISEVDLDAMTDRVSSPVTTTTGDSAAARISRALFENIWPGLPAGTERLYVVPPARLEKLPLEALPEPGAFVASNRGDAQRAGTIGDRFPVSYVSSAAVLMALDARQGPRAGITVLADPVVNSNRGEIAALEPQLRGAVSRPLPGAREEARRLRQPGATVLVGHDATLHRLRASRPAAVLHFATHAFEDAHSPELGGLVLAGEPALFTKAGIESLKASAELVTLSGCATLGTNEYSGEGTLGLARAFLVGGASSVVATRWDVTDQGAMRFMDVFYAGLKAGAPRDQSLRQARQALLREHYAPRDCWAFALIGVGDRPVSQWAANRSGESVHEHK